MEGEAFTTRVAKPREMTLNTPYMHAHMRMPMHVSIFSLFLIHFSIYLGPQVASWPRWLLYSSQRTRHAAPAGFVNLQSKTSQPFSAHA